MPGIPAQAAIEDPALRAAYPACGRHSKPADPTEYALIRLMPPGPRPVCRAVPCTTLLDRAGLSVPLRSRHHRDLVRVSCASVLLSAGGGER
ncbi:hypothetical protein ACWD4G_00590 [Streptomyces sp. NPDC002643]